jgi:iron(III) transport system substrate-binding protein
MFRTRPLLALAAALSLTLAACERSAPQEGAATTAEGEAQVLNLYTSRHYDSDRQLYDGFTEATGIRVNRIESSADLLVERLKAEGASSPADVIMMADAGALWRAQNAGLLQPTTSPILEQRIPAALREAEGRWFGFSRRGRVIVFRKDAAPAPLRADYRDLASPRLKGEVCVRSSENVYNLSLMAALIERWGRDEALRWARGVAANMARPPQGGDVDQIKAVAAGACDAALVNTYYYIRLARSEDPADRAAAEQTVLVFPDQEGAGTHVNVSGAGVAANAPHRAAAVRFLEYLASDQAQAIFAAGNNEYPAVASAPVPEPLAPFSRFKADPMSVAVYGNRQAEAQAVFDEAGWR